MGCEMSRKISGDGENDEDGEEGSEEGEELGDVGPIVGLPLLGPDPFIDATPTWPPSKGISGSMFSRANAIS